MATVFLTASLSSCIGAGENSSIEIARDSYFPGMIGIDLHGEERILPQAFAGTYNIVIVAFEREQQAIVDTWIPIADRWIEEYKGLQFYEVPLIYELNATYRLWVNNGMRTGITDEVARKRTITVYTDREKFLNIMEMKADNIYVLLLDSEGKILWKHKGDASKKAVSSLKKQLYKYVR